MGALCNGFTDLALHACEEHALAAYSLLSAARQVKDEQMTFTATLTMCMLFLLLPAVLSTPKDTKLVMQQLAKGGSLAGVHEAQDYGHMDYIW